MGNSFKRTGRHTSSNNNRENTSTDSTFNHPQTVVLSRNLAQPSRGHSEFLNISSAIDGIVLKKRLNPSTLSYLYLSSEYENSVLRLIEKGGDINIADEKYGCTSLHYAVKYSSHELCEVLVNSGANLNAQNLLGQTPLYLACEYGNVEKIFMLLHYGADPLIPCKKGDIPLLIDHVNKLEMGLRVALYYYTFEDGGLTVPLKVVVRAMLVNCPFFPEMVKKIARITYDKTELRYLNESLPDITYRNFKIFLDNFDYAVQDMLSTCCTVTTYLTAIETMRKTTSKFTDFLYILLDNHPVDAAVRSCCKSFPVIASLCKIFRKNNMPLNTLTKLACCLLSYGKNVTTADLNAVYVFYGRCELFDIMLHMDIEPSMNNTPCCNYCDYEVVQASIMAHFLYDINLSIDKFLARPQWLLSMDLDVLLNYFALPKLKDFFLMYYIEEVKIFEKVVELPTVPLLVELSRNAARDFIIKRYKIQNSRQFYTIIKWLPISNVYKKILTYESKLYNF